VPSLSLFGVVIKMAYGPGETDMRTICCRQLFRTITTLLEQSKEGIVRSAYPGSKKCIEVCFGKCTDTEDIKENKINVTNYVIC
jgi:hypothetical protein